MIMRRTTILETNCFKNRFILETRQKMQDRLKDRRDPQCIDGASGNVISGENRWLIVGKIQNRLWTADFLDVVTRPIVTHCHFY